MPLLTEEGQQNVEHGRRQRHLGFGFAHTSQLISVTDIVKRKSSACAKPRRPRAAWMMCWIRMLVGHGKLGTAKSAIARLRRALALLLPDRLGGLLRRRPPQRRLGARVLRLRIQPRPV